MAMLRAYLIEATYDWLVDHNFTPYLLVDTEYQGVEVPESHIDDDGKILLNLSPEAVVNFHCDDKKIQFDATFDSEIMSLAIPIEAVLELYASETSQGLYAHEFGYGIEVNEGKNDDDVDPDKKPSHDSPGGLHLV